VVVLETPSWWTPAHALLLLVLVLSGTLVAFVWVVALRRQVAQQTSLLRQSEERFRHLALHDPLTGLATRLLLTDRLDIAVEIANRHALCVAVLILDLDRFKQINDTLGHAAGDQVLRETANRLSNAVRKSDTVARMGGDEFVVLLPDLRDAKVALQVAATLVETLAVPIAIDGRETPISVSIGVCALQAGAVNADELLKNADAALYQAKARGRGCFQASEPPQLTRGSEAESEPEL
jgi:diguanylate cyclase (GGDEF)-like protein